MSDISDLFVLGTIFGGMAWVIICNNRTLHAEMSYAEAVYRLRIRAINEGRHDMIETFRYTDDASYNRNLLRLIFFMKPRFPQLPES